MDICIVTADASLARFLTLELAEAGYTATVAETPVAAHLCLCDLDYFTGELPQNTIGFSYDTGKQRRATAFLPRPIHVESLLRAITDALRPVKKSTDAPLLTAERATRRICYGNASVRLSEKEFALLGRLFASDLLTREGAADIFGGNDSNVVDVYMHYLRKKLKTVCPYDIIDAKRGAGYRHTDAVRILFI